MQTITFSPKGASETDLFSLDWGDYPLDSGETISTFAATVTAGGASVAASSFSGTVTTARISGGTLGQTARVTFRITTSASRVLEREVAFRIV